MMIVTVERGDPEFSRLMGPLIRDKAFAAVMWQEAESRWGDFADRGPKAWTLAVTGARDVMAWSATVLTWRDGMPFAICCNHYHVPQFRFMDSVWAETARARQRLIAGVPAEAHVFDQSVPVFEELGWKRGIFSGMSDEPGVPQHHWQQMVWTPAGVCHD